MFISLLMLVFNRGFEKANRFLSGFLFFSALYSVVLYVFMFSNSVKWIAFFCITFPSCFFLLGPLAYFYVRSILADNPRLTKWDYLHFSMFIICFAGTIPLLFNTWQYRLTVGQSVQINISNLSKFRLNIFFPYKINQSIRPLQISFYIIALWWQVWKYFKNSQSLVNHNLQWSIIKKWLITFSSIFTIICFCYSVSLFKNLFYTDKEEFLKVAYNMILVASLGYSSLIIVLFFFPQIIYGLPVAIIHQKAFNEVLPTIESWQEHKKEIAEESDVNEYEKKVGLFNNEYLLVIREAVERVIVSNKYLQDDFTLTRLSIEINIPVHHLSYFFKNILEVKFNDWKNDLRITHAITLIKEGKTANITLPALAKQLGFSSYNTFVKAFKQKTNCSPSEYFVI